MRFGFIAKYRSVWPVQWLCAALDVTCAGFYAWLKRPQSTRASVDAMLSAAIQRSFSDSDRTYGARRVRRDLWDWGHRCGIHRVERLMRRAQLVARRRRRRMPFDVGQRHSCSDPVKTCSGVNLMGDSLEHIDGRRDQTLDRTTQERVGTGDYSR